MDLSTFLHLILETALACSPVSMYSKVSAAFTAAQMITHAVIFFQSFFRISLKLRRKMRKAFRDSRV